MRWQHADLQAAPITPPPSQPQSNCALGGAFYDAWSESLDACLAACKASPSCGGFSFKLSSGTGEPAPAGHGNCTGKLGESCCYMQAPSAIKSQVRRAHFSCWEKPIPPGTEQFTLVPDSTSPFPHFWEAGINSPHSAMTLRADYQAQMAALHEHIGYKYTRIHAPFSRDYSVAQGPNATSYYNPFATYPTEHSINPFLDHSPEYSARPSIQQSIEHSIFTGTTSCSRSG